MDSYKLKDVEYVKKEAEILYDSMFKEDEVFEKKKYVYAMIFNSICGIFECQIGGIQNLELSKDEIKEIIKDFVDNNPKQFQYKK